jgi:hypothetical protein
MLALFVRFGARAAVFSALILVGCASSAPQLISKSPTVPEGVDLSGRWVVRADSRAGRSQMDGLQEKLVVTSRSQRSRRQKGSSDGSAQVFIEYGESLKISQTDFGIFISYDIETLDDSGTTLFESWHLDSDDSVLIRDIRLSKGDEESFSLRQLFDRT